LPEQQQQDLEEERYVSASEKSDEASPSPADHESEPASATGSTSDQDEMQILACQLTDMSTTCIEEKLLHLIRRLPLVLQDQQIYHNLQMHTLQQKMERLQLLHSEQQQQLQQVQAERDILLQQQIQSTPAAPGKISADLRVFFASARAEILQRGF